jgi:competence protein ComEA
MRMFLHDYFCFSRSERRGTLVFAVLIVLVFFFPYVYNALRRPAVYPADPEFIDEINALFTANDSISEDTVPLVLSSPGRQGIDTSSLTIQRSVVNPSYSGGMIIEVNSADTAGLMQIRGIGEVLSRRIIRYRDILGGYADLQQLREVYGIDDERHGEIVPYLTADTRYLIRIDVNTAEFSVLLRHPYLNFEQVSQLFRLRDRQPIGSLVDLQELPAFSEADIEKLSPYLSF